MNEIWLPFLCGVLLLIIEGPVFIPVLHRLKFGQTIREDGPQRHLVKAGTPTMGGLMFILPVILAALLCGKSEPALLLAILSFLGFGGIGFTDDFLKVVKKRSLGLTARQKLIGQFLFIIIFLFLVVRLTGRGTNLIIPVSGYVWQLGIWYYPLMAVFFVGMVNAVNLTDGLDGLVSGISFIVFLCFMLISASCAAVPPIVGVDYHNLVVFAAAMAGVCLGFIFYNRYPAKIFMGDTGAFAIGGALIALAVLTKTELVFIVLGGVYLIEAFSVILQVAGFKLTGKRIFRMAPLHHHFELKGWKETKVVAVFWLVGALFGILALILVTI